MLFPNIKEQDQPTRVQTLEGLRGLAILMVTLFHMWRVKGEPELFGKLDFGPWLGYGFSGVHIFYTLAGFAAVYPLLCTEQAGLSRPSWKKFYQKRFLRLYPAYLVALFVWLPIWASWKGWDEWEWHLMAHLTFTHTLFPSTVYSISGVLWFMGPLVQFFILFPILYRGFRKCPGGAVVVSFAIAIGLGSLAKSLNIPSNTWDANIIQKLPLFVCGMYAAQLCFHPPKGLPWLLNVAFAAGLIRVFVWPYIISTPVIHILSWNNIFPTLCWAGLIWGLAAPLGENEHEPWAVWIRAWRVLFLAPPLHFLAAISYSLFLHNYFVTFLPKWFFNSHIVPCTLPWYTVSFTLTVLVAVTAYMSIEKALPLYAKRSLQRVQFSSTRK